MQKIFTRVFVLNFFANFMFSFVFFILIPTLPIYLSKLGVLPVEIGILIGIFSVTSLVLRPFIGRGLLKIPERNFMIVGSILFSLSSIFYLFTPPFWPLFIVRAFQGIGWALFATASLTLATRVSPEAHRGQSISYFYLAINIAFALGPYLGVFIINSFNFTILFLVCTGLSLGSLFITLQLEKNKIESFDAPSLQDQPFLSREALPPAIIAFMGSIIWGALTAFFPLFALSHGVANTGLFFAVLAITLILGRGFGGRILDIYSREKVIFPCIAAQITAMTILAFSTTFPMFILVAVIWGMGNAFLFPSLIMYVIDHSGSSRGPAIGTYMALSDLGAGMGSVIMGIILQLTNYQIMFLSLVFTGFLNLTYFHFILKKRGRSRHANL